MITIQILGLDQFVVGHYSKDHTANLANLFECDEDLINFYAPNSMVFHFGTEQTSWNTIVIIRAPKKYHAMEADIADYILKTLCEFSINLEIEFEYFEEGSHYEYINPAYPRYITGSNIRDVSVDYGMPGEEGEESDDDDSFEEIDVTDPNKVFIGNAFEGFEGKLEEAKKNLDK